MLWVSKRAPILRYLIMIQEPGCRIWVKTSRNPLFWGEISSLFERVFWVFARVLAFDPQTQSFRSLTKRLGVSSCFELSKSLEREALSNSWFLSRQRLEGLKEFRKYMASD